MTQGTSNRQEILNPSATIVRGLHGEVPRGFHYHVEALWDTIVERNAVPGPTEAQKAELDRRLSEHAASPDDVVPWSEMKDTALARIRR